SAGGIQNNGQCGTGGAACQPCSNPLSCSPNGVCSGGGSDGGGSAAGPVMWGSQPHCSTGLTCCVTIAGGTANATCLSNCPNPNDIVACGSPADCSAGSVCCGTIVLDG